MNKGTFGTLLGGNCRARMIEYFIEGKNLDHSLGDIAKVTGFSKATVYEEAKQLLREKVIRKSRIISGVQLYTFNYASEQGKYYDVMFDAVILQILAQASRGDYDD